MQNGLILLGAGPGDPELITVKGLKALQKADVILYDALASKDLLVHSKPTSKHICVGKRSGAHSMGQSAINSLIVKYAKTNLVVRLKGGDPFVFGRGFEERAIAQEHGINTEVIPGISSAIAGPGIAGIPVTTRNVSRSFWVITATSSENTLNHDMNLAAQSSATIVILMGIKKLRKIIELIKEFRGPQEPIAVIQNATIPEQSVVIGNCQDIIGKFEKQNFGGPGIIVAGQVIEESKSAQMLVETLQEHNCAA